MHLVQAVGARVGGILVEKEGDGAAGAEAFPALHAESIVGWRPCIGIGGLLILRQAACGKREGVLDLVGRHGPIGAGVGQLRDGAIRRRRDFFLAAAQAQQKRRQEQCHCDIANASHRDTSFIENTLKIS